MAFPGVRASITSYPLSSGESTSPPVSVRISSGTRIMQLVLHIYRPSVVLWARAQDFIEYDHR